MTTTILDDMVVGSWVDRWRIVREQQPKVSLNELTPQDKEHEPPEEDLILTRWDGERQQRVGLAESLHPLQLSPSIDGAARVTSNAYSHPLLSKGMNRKASEQEQNKSE